MENFDKFENNSYWKVALFVMDTVNNENKKMIKRFETFVLAKYYLKYKDIPPCNTKYEGCKELAAAIINSVLSSYKEKNKKRGKKL